MQLHLGANMTQTELQLSPLGSAEIDKAYRKIGGIRVFVLDLGKTTGRWHTLSGDSPMLSGEIFVRVEDLAD
jgi:hypothetical protein